MVAGAARLWRLGAARQLAKSPVDRFFNRRETPPPGVEFCRNLFDLHHYRGCVGIGPSGD
jgi:hypothetical protein